MTGMMTGQQTGRPTTQMQRRHARMMGKVLSAWRQRWALTGQHQRRRTMRHRANIDASLIALIAIAANASGAAATFEVRLRGATALAEGGRLRLRVLLLRRHARLWPARTARTAGRLLLLRWMRPKAGRETAQMMRMMRMRVGRQLLLLRMRVRLMRMHAGRQIAVGSMQGGMDE